MVYCRVVIVFELLDHFVDLFITISPGQYASIHCLQQYWIWPLSVGGRKAVLFILLLVDVVHPMLASSFVVPDWNGAACCRLGGRPVEATGVVCVRQA